MCTNLLHGFAGGISPYLSLLFMNRRRHFGRFLTFDDASPRERTRWRSAFLWFMRKATLACSRRGPSPQRPRPAQQLLIKSPVHTARIATMLELFPDARFIFIHRDPLEARAWVIGYRKMYLQCPFCGGAGVVSTCVLCLHLGKPAAVLVGGSQGFQPCATSFHYKPDQMYSYVHRIFTNISGVIIRN